MGGLCWEGVINFRRLVLVLLFTFINDKLMKQMALSFGCFVILLFHVFSQPFRKKLSNMAETISLCLLVIIAGNNLVKAVFFHTQTIPQGDSYLVMVVYEWIETACVGLLPIVIIAFVIFTVLFKTMFSCVARGSSTDDDTSLSLERDNWNRPSSISPVRRRRRGRQPHNPGHSSTDSTYINSGLQSSALEGRRLPPRRTTSSSGRIPSSHLNGKPSLMSEYGRFPFLRIKSFDSDRHTATTSWQNNSEHEPRRRSAGKERFSESSYEISPPPRRHVV